METLPLLMHIYAFTSSWPWVDGDELCSSGTTQVQFNSEWQCRKFCDIYIGEKTATSTLAIKVLSPREVHMDEVATPEEEVAFLQHSEEVGWWIQTWQREVLEDNPRCGGLVTVPTQETTDKIPDKNNTTVHCHRAGRLPEQGVSSFAPETPLSWWEADWARHVNG